MATTHLTTMMLRVLVLLKWYPLRGRVSISLEIPLLLLIMRVMRPEKMTISTKKESLRSVNPMKLHIMMT